VTWGALNAASEPIPERKLNIVKHSSWTQLLELMARSPIQTLHPAINLLLLEDKDGPRLWDLAAQ
jgi:hypothetical protein